MPKGIIKNRNTNGFDKNPQNINRSGANRKTINAVNKRLEENGYPEASKDDILSCYLRLIQLPLAEVKRLSNEKDAPGLVVIVSEAILSKKGFDIIERMLDRAHGKPMQSTDITTDGEKITEIDYTKLSTSALKEIINARRGAD